VPFRTSGNARPADTNDVKTTTRDDHAEAARLDALLEYRILDTPPEQAFDDLVELAAAVCDAPVAALAFVDSDRSWLKARHGVDLSEFPRDAALATEALQHNGVFVVRDALAVPRYRASPVVANGFRFFAGVPLLSRGGHAIGTVCVLDRRARDLTATQKNALHAIGRQVMGQLELQRISESESVAQHRFSALVEQLPGGIYIEDFGAASGWYFSPQVERVTGYDPAEWVSEPDFFSRVLHEDDRDRVLDAFARVHETHETIQIEYRLIAKDGRVVWIQDDASVAFNAEGEPLYLLGCMTDVTARNENEVEFRATAAERDRLLERERAQNEKLRSVDRLKDEFIALVSHELRTPLTSIRGYLELVMDDSNELHDDHRSFLEVVDRNADRLLGLVNDLLVVAQAEAGSLSFEWGEVELEPLLALCVEAAKPAAETAGVKLGFTSEPLGPIVGDHGRLAQLVDNLISNAIKFTPAGGTVDLRVGAGAAGAVIEVADTGIGIAVKEQKQLFERFFRTHAAGDRAIPGSGLGLSISKAIVEAHGGTIGFESAAGRGTIFRVELPLEQPVRTTPRSAALTEA
jgi:PAS domain S-box-containing protein